MDWTGLQDREGATGLAVNIDSPEPPSQVRKQSRVRILHTFHILLSHTISSPSLHGTAFNEYGERESRES